MDSETKRSRTLMDVTQFKHGNGQVPRNYMSCSLADMGFLTDHILLSMLGLLWHPPCYNKSSYKKYCM